MTLLKGRADFEYISVDRKPQIYVPGTGTPWWYYLGPGGGSCAFVWGFLVCAHYAHSWGVFLSLPNKILILVSTLYLVWHQAKGTVELHVLGGDEQSRGVHSSICSQHKKLQ